MSGLDVSTTTAIDSSMKAGATYIEPASVEEIERALQAIDQTCPTHTASTTVPGDFNYVELMGAPPLDAHIVEAVECDFDGVLVADAMPLNYRPLDTGIKVVNVLKREQTLNGQAESVDGSAGAASGRLDVVNTLGQMTPSLPVAIATAAPDNATPKYEVRGTSTGLRG